MSNPRSVLSASNMQTAVRLQQSIERRVMQAREIQSELRVEDLAPAADDQPGEVEEVLRQKIEETN